jgi:hypothetical protein
MRAGTGQILGKGRWGTGGRLLASAVLLACAARAQRFYPDDPIWKEPPPSPVSEVKPQKLDNLIDFYKNTFHEKGERHRPGKIIPSAGTNTLGEVPDNAWYTNRHRLARMSLAELAEGPNHTGPPSANSKWTVISVKAEGVTPGFTIRDGANRRYLLKFDPKSNPELATGADVVSAKFFYALGYNVPENYAVRFRRDQLIAGEDVHYTDRFGSKRILQSEHIDELLRAVSPHSDGTYRALASLYIGGTAVGGFKYYGRRADDPNELAPHEHLRVLRGLYVFAAWLNHTDAKSLNSLDSVVDEGGRRFIKHYLLDFGASLGSDSLYAKDPRLGHDYFLDWGPGLVQLTTLGFYVPKYARVHYPKEKAVGNFDYEAFNPNHWKSNYPNAAFESRLPGDEFWGAKQVMAFSNDEIRAMVHTGDYSRTEAETIIAEILARRRDLIGRAVFSKISALDGFRVEGDRLTFQDLAAVYKIRTENAHPITWARFDNQRNELAPVAGSNGDHLPQSALSSSEGSYWAAKIEDGQIGKSVTVFLRREKASWKVAGIEREGENAWGAH